MSTSSSTTYEVHLAIYDLSMGMARSLSGQFLGQEHAVDMIPHTAILVHGKEWFYGQGIEWCSPHEFRASRGIHPIEIQPLGHTTCTEQQFEDWCRAQAVNGNFGNQSYDFFHNNCNNFSEQAARHGLRLQQSVPSWILELPQKFLSSPMGMIVRPMLEQMQMSNVAPTNVSAGGGGSFGKSQPTFASSHATPTAAAAANPWANIPAATAVPTTQPSSPPQSTSVDASISSKATNTSLATPLLDKQTALLSTDTGVVKICIDRLKPGKERSDILSKLSDTKASWTQAEIDSSHQYLREVIENDNKNTSFALMLLRLLVLGQPLVADTTKNNEQTQSTQMVANLILEGKVTSLATRSMAWCVLSNAMGSTQLPGWVASTGTNSHDFIQAIERALGDCDPSTDGASSATHISLRQSVAAFLYNSSREMTINNDANDSSTELSEGMMSILLGCLEHLNEETDVTTMQRLYMAVGQLLKSPKFGETAASLVKDLGLIDDDIGNGKVKEIESLAKEVASLLR